MKTQPIGEKIYQNLIMERQISLKVISWGLNRSHLWSKELDRIAQENDEDDEDMLTYLRKGNL